MGYALVCKAIVSVVDYWSFRLVRLNLVAILNRNYDVKGGSLEPVHYAPKTWQEKTSSSISSPLLRRQLSQHY